MLQPEELRLITAEAYIGINLVENNGLSNYLSLANKFFDYIHAGIPQLCELILHILKSMTNIKLRLITDHEFKKHCLQQLNNLFKR